MNWAELFAYTPTTGELVWRLTRQGRGCIAGRVVGTTGHHGYRTVHIAGKRYYVHRIVWQLVHGPIPHDRCIDHIDGDRGNNRIANLRLVTLSQNQRNRRVAANSPLGIAGVRLKKPGFEVNCAGRYVGFFADFFEACCARKAAERHEGYHVNAGRPQ